MPQEYTCLTCGFLTVRGREFTATERQALATDRPPADAVDLRCYLELWDEISPDSGLPDVLREAQTPRTCAGHLSHEPGQSPKRHLLTSVRRQRRPPKWRVATLAGGLLVVGALVVRSCLS